MAIQVTEAEWKIMECLWDHAPQTMGEITSTLEPATGWTRQTVITLLKEAHKLLNQLFRGSASLLVNLLVNSGDLSAKDLREILEAQLAQKK